MPRAAAGQPIQAGAHIYPCICFALAAALAWTTPGQGRDESLKRRKLQTGRAVTRKFSTNSKNIGKFSGDPHVNALDGQGIAPPAGRGGHAAHGERRGQAFNYAREFGKGGIK